MLFFVKMLNDVFREKMYLQVLRRETRDYFILCVRKFELLLSLTCACALILSVLRDCRRLRDDVRPLGEAGWLVEVG